MGPKAFQHAWLSECSLWLRYPAALKESVCYCCCLFPQPVMRGMQDTFIKAYAKYKDFSDPAREQSKSRWCSGSHADASNSFCYEEENHVK